MALEPSRDRLQYDELLRQNLMEAFGKAVDDLAPYGRREVVDAAEECLILAMLQDLRRFLPPNQAEPIVSVFAREVRRAVEVATAVYTAPRRRNKP
jgi:hypothetical protein